ncbi:MAG: SDR family oxidoreductase [Acidimicrobiales bacterium]|nr:SDR family oxidoreductase [Acidimicrobiales bacterium]
MTADAPRRVALVADAGRYVGPSLVRELARRGHDLVISNPADGLVAEVEGLGSQVVVVDRAHNLARPESAPALVDAALERFGQLDAAVAFTGSIIGGRFTKSSIDDLRKLVEGCLEAPYHFLKAVTAPMIEAGSGQVLLMTSAAGARPVPGAPLYSSVRAGATMLAKNVADEIAPTGVQVNALGTNFMDFPEFHDAVGSHDPEVRKLVEAQVPMRRMGTVEECAAFAMAFLDGTSGFTTGQFVAYAGGWA